MTAVRKQFSALDSATVDSYEVRESRGLLAEPIAS